tara:strand:+ start:4166 stop:4657 length:492 start_codon:yes stop_codon:yes gene_type:complete
MAYQRLQVSEGLAVIPSDTVPIPDPATEVTSGTTVGAAVAFKLVDTGVDFTTMGIQTNAIVYNITPGSEDAAFVTAVDSATTLSLSKDITGAGQDYVIYNAATKACTLYVGVAGNLIVQMASQRDAALTDTVTFNNIPSSSFLPILVTRVAQASTASNIIALW